VHLLTASTIITTTSILTTIFHVNLGWLVPPHSFPQYIHAYKAPKTVKQMAHGD